MTTGSPFKILIGFATPILLGNLLQLAYSLIDTHIIGVYLGDTALAAVSATTQLSTLFIGFFVGLTQGFAISISRYFGSQDLRKVKSAFVLSLVMGTGIAVVISLTILLFLHPILIFLNVDEILMGTASSYIRIIIVGLTITMLSNILLSSARAIGDSVTPLLTLCFSVALNVVGDFLFIAVFHTDVWGAALATVLAQSATMIVCAIYILRKYDFFRFDRNTWSTVEAGMASNMMQAGISMGLMSSLVMLGSVILQSGINGLGHSYIVAQNVARQITSLLMSIFVATGQALTTFCSQNYGSGKIGRVKDGMRAGYIITCVWCIAVLAIVYTLAPTLIRVITGSGDVVMIDAANRYLRFDTTLYVLVAIIFVQRHSLQGIGDTKTPLISSGIEMVGKIILTYTLIPKMGYNGVILVEPIVWIVMIIPLIVKVRQWQNNYGC